MRPRKTRWRGVPRPPFVATISALVVACGSTESDGAPPTCPVALPSIPECTSDGLRCDYDFSCQSGPASITYACTNGRWTPDTACTFSGDSCEGRRLHCQDGGWLDFTGAGGNPPAPCPADAPTPGQSCQLPPAFAGALSCGYRCSDGSWTEGLCVSASTGGVWLADGVCVGDCSAEEVALRDYAAEHSECSTDADCQILTAECALTSRHCSGAFALGASADATAWATLSAALASCAAEAAGSWTCAPCNAAPPPPTCVEGRCMLAL